MENNQNQNINNESQNTQTFSSMMNPMNSTNKSNKKYTIILLGLVLIIVLIYIIFTFVLGGYKERKEIVNRDDGFVEHELYKPEWYLIEKTVYNENNIRQRMYVYKEYDKDTTLEPYNSGDYLDKEYVYDETGKEIIEVIEHSPYGVKQESNSKP